MPKYKFFKTFDTGTLVNGATYESYFTPEKDITVEKIYLKAQDGTELKKSTFYIKAKDKVFTREVVPAGIIGEDALISEKLDWEIKAQEKMDFTFKNLEGADKAVYIIFVYWEEVAAIR